jgi:hypothetical protein
MTRANDNMQGCFDLPFSPLMTARGVAVSPDNKSVYVASIGAASVGHFFRGGPEGQIAWDGCLSNDGSQNCGDLPEAPIADANAVAASPDGKSGERPGRQPSDRPQARVPDRPVSPTVARGQAGLEPSNPTIPK